MRTVLTVRYMFSLRLACFIFIRIADHIELLLIFYLIVSSIHFDFLFKKMLYQFVVFSQSNGWYRFNDTNCSHVTVDSVRSPGRNAPAVCFSTCRWASPVEVIEQARPPPAAWPAACLREFYFPLGTPGHGYFDQVPSGC